MYTMQSHLSTRQCLCCCCTSPSVCMQNTAEMSGSQSLMQVHRQREKERERRQNRERERRRAGVTSPIPVGAEHTICVRALVTEETLKKVKFSKQRKMHNDWQKKMRVEDRDEAGMSSEFGEE